MGGYHHHSVGRSAQTQRVAIVGAIANVILAGVKLVVGFFAQSAALVADGIHSVSDLLSDVLVWFAARHAAEAPDDEHPYGHGRFETAATLALGILLGFVALGIVWEAVERTASGETSVPGILAIYAALFSIAANEALYWYSILVARRINSPMLKANAWHHRSDAVSSIVVLVGVAGAIMGWPYLDAVAAIIVGAMVAKIGWGLGWEAMRELVDTALDEKEVQRARQTIMSIDGVRSIHMLRTRKQGHEASADVHVQVAPRLSVSEGHMISQAVEDRLIDAVDAITDVTVHVDPEDDEAAPPCSGLPLRDEALAQLHRLWPDLPQPAEVVLHYLSGKIDIELRLPLSQFANEEESNSLHESLYEAVKGHQAFGDVALFYCQCPVFVHKKQGMHHIGADNKN